MRSRPLRLKASLLTMIGLLAGCAVACSAPSPDLPAAPPGPFPPRPFPIEVTRIDPCEVLTPDQASQRNARKGPPRTVTIAGVAAPSKACGWTSTDRYRYNFQTIEAGAELGLETPGQSSVVVVDGFGAVLNVAGQTNVTGPGVPLTCQMYIDVNTNQSIRLQVQSDDTSTYGSPTEQKESCGRLQGFAHDVLSNLSSQQR